MPAATSTSKPITVSIVSHGQQALILPLLEQLNRLCADSIAKIVLTINVPEEERLIDVACSLPLERVGNVQPRGFGANHNAAFSLCQSEWFLVLNPDMRFETDILGPLLALANHHTGLLAPRIFEPPRNAPEPHRAIITPPEILLRSRPGYRPPVAPAWIPGMFMLFHAETYRRIGGFDERFFMYGEDFDVCARLALAGQKIVIAEQLRAIHEAQRASHRDVRHLWWHMRSLAKVWSSMTFWRYRTLIRRRSRQVVNRSAP